MVERKTTKGSKFFIALIQNKREEENKKVYVMPLSQIVHVNPQSFVANLIVLIAFLVKLIFNKTWRGFRNIDISAISLHLQISKFKIESKFKIA